MTNPEVALTAAKIAARIIEILPVVSAARAALGI